MAFFASTVETPALVTTQEQQETHRVLALGARDKLVIAAVSESSSTVEVIELTTASVEPSFVLCGAVSVSGRHVAVGMDNKTLAMWKKEGGAGWTWVGVRVLPKRAMVLCFTKDDKFIIIGDKTGEVYRYSTKDWATSGEHLLGHFSMLLDMVLSPDNRHVITCDRDEKIRVSKFPNSYNIETFCLAHTEFVSTLALCLKWPHYLLSGSGDGSVKVWEWMEGKLLDSQLVGGTQSGGEREAVTKISCSSSDPPFVAVMLEKSTQVSCFSLSAEGILEPCLEGSIQLPVTPWDIVHDWSNRLWVCLQDPSEPVMCFQWKDRKMENIRAENPLLDGLCEWQYFEGLQASGTKDWNQMRKQVFDNMGSYLARKEERIKSKTQFNVPAGSDRREQNDSDSSKPPEKRIKVTCDDKSNS